MNLSSLSTKSGRERSEVLVMGMWHGQKEKDILWKEAKALWSTLLHQERWPNTKPAVGFSSFTLMEKMRRSEEKGMALKKIVDQSELNPGVFPPRQVITPSEQYHWATHPHFAMLMVLNICKRRKGRMWLGLVGTRLQGSDYPYYCQGSHHICSKQ